MATGLYLTPDGMVLVDYGIRKIPISPAQYRANGYKPSLEKLMDKPPSNDSSQAGPELNTRGKRRRWRSVWGPERAGPG
jgi:hypothetical protein